MSPDVIVVGAGAIGSSIAYQLAKAGLKVMVFERGQVGGEATGASAGMIQTNPDRSTPAALSALEAESARLYAALATELLDRTGMDIGYRSAPLLHVCLHEGEEPKLRAHRATEAPCDRQAPDPRMRNDARTLGHGRKLHEFGDARGSRFGQATQRVAVEIDHVIVDDEALAKPLQRVCRVHLHARRTVDDVR